MREPFKDRMMEMFSGQIPPERKQPKMRAVAPVRPRGAETKPDATFSLGDSEWPKIGLIKRFWYLTLGLLLCCIGLSMLGWGIFFIWTMLHGGG